MDDTHTPANQPRRARVIRAYEREFPDPIVVQAGEPLTLSDQFSNWNQNPAWRWVWCTDARGKGGYVPLSVIETRDHASSARRDYSAVELTAQVGETLTIEDADSGWYWCANQRGEHGWIPIDHVEAEPA